MVVDLDRVDDRADIAFACIGVARVQLRVRQSREGVDLLCIDSGRQSALTASMIEDRFGPVALSLQSGGALSQDIVELDDAVFNRAIKPPRAIFAVGQFLLQSQQPALGGLALCRLALNQHLRSETPSAMAIVMALLVRGCDHFRSHSVMSHGPSECDPSGAAPRSGHAITDQIAVRPGLQITATFQTLVNLRWPSRLAFTLASRPL
ncbi:hypothetical protein ACRQ5Q_08510 [Bradyrhizobium sp. PMVTL-01]|uniref:hypothetical protein n=1 Tax=Bradyrhizobium sp. PMVTL-01 TaxID=3434999 RepID=UPI003F72EE42